MKYLKLFFKCLGLFIIVIPLGCIILIIEGGVPLNPTKEDWIVIIISAFVGTVIAFIVGFIRIRRGSDKNYDIKR